MPRRARQTAPPRALWSWAVLCLVFAGVHVFYWRLAVVDPDIGFGDVGLYQRWAWDGLRHGHWPVLDFPWVYPALALVPVTLPGLLSTAEWAPYAHGWMAIVTVLDATAAVALARRAWLAAVWWLVFLALLGPVAFGRLDAVVVPLTIVALLAAAGRPRAAAVLLTVGAWVKVAPGALIVPLLLTARRALRDVVVPAAGVCVVVVGLVAAGGGAANLASFTSAQGGRGLQLESLAGSWWVVQWVTGGPARAAYNEELVTWEVHGPGTGVAADALGWLLPVAVVALAWLTWRARSHVPASELLVRSALALTLALVVTNKVGSPQFVAWLAAPLAVGLAGRAGAGNQRAGLDRLDWPLLGLWGLVLALLTHLVFPIGYYALVTGEAWAVWALVVRNVLLLGLFVVAVVRLAVVGGDRGLSRTPSAAEPGA